MALALLCLPSLAHAADPAALARHIDILASDAMEGRRPGTPGDARATAYIAEQMAAIGLLPGAPDGSWLAPVALVERVSEEATLRIAGNGRAKNLPAGGFMLTGRDAEARIDGAPILFAGYGMGEHPIGGLDPTGKVVILLSAAPPGTQDAPSASDRAAAIRALGARAVLLLAPEAAPWKRIRAGYAEGHVRLAAEPSAEVSGVLSWKGWQAIAKAAGRDPATLAAVALDVRATIAVRTRLRAFSSPNVIGRLAGAGAGGEALLYLAHWDHLGLCRPTGAPDRICNGAVDNASGVASLIEIARALKAGPTLSRDLYFVATTAEEMGLLGAQALADAPPVPLAKIAAVLNFDTVALAPAGTPVAMVGRGMTPIDAAVDSAGKALGRAVSDSLAANAFIRRQDGWVFTKAGVPSVMVGSGFADMALLERYFATHYHAPTDDIALPIELGGAAEDVDFHVALARILADPARFPLPAR